MSRDFKAHNFGLKARKIDVALHFAAKEAARMGANSETTVGNARTTYTQFSRYLKTCKIFDLRKVDRSHVQGFADQLRDRVENGKLSWPTATEYLGRVNAALEKASGVRTACVTATEAGFPARDGIARQNHAQQLDGRELVLSAQTQAILGLERTCGLRAKEAVLLNAKAASQLEIGDDLVVDRGTKGGRVRVVPILKQAQLDAIHAAAEIQLGKYSQIAAESSYKEFRARLYNEISQTSIRQHSLRHAYAQDRYREISGVDCPVVAGISHREHRKWIAKQLGCSVRDAAALDREARLTLARELGHGRIDVTNGYLG